MSQNEVVEPVIGLIGGSGLYDIDGLEEKEWRTVETPWGLPSDQLLFGRLEGVRCVFLPRHGRGHPIPPSRLNYRANIAAMKMSGVTDIVSLSAVGSLKEELPPGHFVIVDQFIDRTIWREKAFLTQAALPISPWPTRCAPVLAMCWKHRATLWGWMSHAAAPIW